MSPIAEKQKTTVNEAIEHLIARAQDPRGLNGADVAELLLRASQRLAGGGIEVERQAARLSMQPAVVKEHDGTVDGAIGGALGRVAVPGTALALVGELGAGKTTFVRGACRALGIDAPIVSPTFTIGRRYEAAGGQAVSHLDLYRLASLATEEEGLLDDYLTPDAVSFVEYSWEDWGYSQENSAGPHDAFGIQMLGNTLLQVGSDEQKAKHLPAIAAPTLCLNGTRDALCRRDLMEVVLQRVRPTFRMHWLEGADHMFHVLKSSGRTDADVLDEVPSITLQNGMRKAPATALSTAKELHVYRENTAILDEVFACLEQAGYRVERR